MLRIVEYQFIAPLICYSC